MAINNNNASLNSMERSSTMSTYPISQRVNFPLIFGVAFLLLAVGGVGYYLGRQGSSINQTTNIGASIPTPISTRTLTLTPQPTVTPSLIPTQIHAEPSTTRIITQNGMVVYEHATAHYTLEYPSSWASEVVPKGLGNDYEMLYIRSVDYQKKDAVLLKGAQIIVRVQNTNAKSINDVDNNSYGIYSSYGLYYGMNKTRITFNDFEAIQYDLTNELATGTEFVKEGKHYFIKYIYVNENSKHDKWNTYLNILRSFKLK
jgi:hypothetical protein